MRGAFEAHVTVEAKTPAQLAALRARAAEWGIACVEIELAHGAHRAQPMTSSHHCGELASVIAEVDALRARIAGAGFAIARVKLEADVENAGVPAGDDGGAGYFEAHVKLRDGGADALARLAEIAARGGARLSRNARRAGERFATLRVYRAGLRAADAEIAALAAAFGDSVLGVIREYVVHDSRVELDAGWLEPPGERCP